MLVFHFDNKFGKSVISVVKQLSSITFCTLFENMSFPEERNFNLAAVTMIKDVFRSQKMRNKAIAVYLVVTTKK